MGYGCRDCPRCTESFVSALFMLPFRLLWSLMIGWNIGLFRRNCPQCGHLIGIHYKRGGRFVD